MYYYDVLVRGAGGPKPVLTYSSSAPMRPGCVVSVSLSRRRLAGMVIKRVDKPPFAVKPLEALADRPIPKAYRQLLDWLSRYYAVSPAMALRLLMPAKLPQKLKPPLFSTAKPRGLARLKPSPSQQQAMADIAKAGTGTFVLHGATASGKTLVYRELVKQTMKQGRSAILLVPEIALTPQLAADFADISERVIVSHSGLTNAERQRIWLYCLQQKSPVLLIGPRSTLFYPLANLGLVIIDEAHEQSYKQEQSPRYQAQTVAAKLTQLTGAKLVLGSATPRVSDYWQARRRSAPIIELKRHQPAKSKVTVIDQTNKDSFKRSRIISDKLLSSLESTLTARRQSLLYLNRRGTASMAICADCGWAPLCPRCDLLLSLHHDDSGLVCHQCGWRDHIPINCPVCGSSELVFSGAGTKAVEREIKRLLPAARVGRFDSDNPRALSFSRLYPDIYEGRYDILIGTQSLAVGLDLPGLKLVGVVSADSELYLPDYTAPERAFQLLYQVIGRAGRQGGGQVIIQTHQPSHYAIDGAIRQDYQRFYQAEIKQRQTHGYPPFGFLLGAVVSSRSSASGQDQAKRLADQLKNRFGFKYVLGPAQAFYAKRGGHYRQTLVVKSTDRRALVRAADFISAQPGWQADIDPINLLF